LPGEGAMQEIAQKRDHDRGRLKRKDSRSRMLPMYFGRARKVEKVHERRQRKGETNSAEGENVKGGQGGRKDRVHTCCTDNGLAQKPKKGVNG